MQKRILYCLMIGIFLINLGGCSNHSESMSLKICGSYAVPGMFCSDLKGNVSSCEVIETDSQGRILFTYTARHLITDQQETAYVICQKYDAEYVYYYEDVCYLLCEATEKAILALKEQNDWNKPLNTTKMSSRPNKSTMDSFIAKDTPLEYSDIKNACKRRFGLENGDIETLSFIDMDTSGKEMFLLRFCRNNKIETYVILIESNYQIRTLIIEGNTVNSISPHELAEFKTRYDWKGGQ